MTSRYHGVSSGFQFDSNQDRDITTSPPSHQNKVTKPPKALGMVVHKPTKQMGDITVGGCGDVHLVVDQPSDVTVNETVNGSFELALAASTGAAEQTTRTRLFYRQDKTYS